MLKNQIRTEMDNWFESEIPQPLSVTNSGSNDDDSLVGNGDESLYDDFSANSGDESLYDGPC